MIDHMSENARSIRLPFMVTPAEVAAIDAWRYKHHVPTRAEAIRRLIELGLGVDAHQPPGAPSQSEQSSS